MKLLIIVPDISQSGGTERAATNLANMLQGAGYTIVLLSVSSIQDSKPFYSLNDTVKIIHLSLQPIPTDIFKKIKWYPNAINRLKQSISEILPHLIFGEGHNINAMLPFIRTNNRVPIIGCEHIVFTSIPLSSRLIMKLLYTKLNGLIALSSQARMKMKELNKNIVVIPNTLPFITKKISPKNSKRLLMVGRLRVEKGYDRLVAIAQILKTKYPLWHIDIFGEGDLKDQLVTLYKEANVDDYITINAPQKNIQDEYLSSSIYLMTSYSEAMPMVILEAMSCGVPVIGYKCEGTSELIHDNEDGFLVNDGDIKTIVEKISILIENSELRNIMGLNARKNALKYSPEFIVNIWKALINEQINDNSL